MKSLEFSVKKDEFKSRVLINFSPQFNFLIDVLYILGSNLTVKIVKNHLNLI